MRLVQRYYLKQKNYNLVNSKDTNFFNITTKEWISNKFRNSSNLFLGRA